MSGPPRVPILRPTGEPAHDIFAREVQRNAEDVARDPWLDFSEVRDVTIGTTTTLVSHKLGRRFRGWTLIDIRGDARVWRDGASAADPSQHLPLVASATVVVSLRVH